MKFNGEATTDLIESLALSHKNDYIQIYSSSWGPVDNGFTVDGPEKLLRHVFETSVKQVGIIGRYLKAVLCSLITLPYYRGAMEKAQSMYGLLAMVVTVMIHVQLTATLPVSTPSLLALQIRSQESHSTMSNVHRRWLSLLVSTLTHFHLPQILKSMIKL